MDDNFFSSLSHGDTIAILLRLHETDGHAIMKDLSDIVSNYQTRRVRVAELEEDGLIDVEITYTPQKFTNIHITDKGRMVATSLATVNMFVAHDKRYQDKGICMKNGETILRTLISGAPLKLMDILKVIPTPHSVNKTLNALEEDGLITITIPEKGYRTKLIQLTSLGKQCADTFDAVHKLIKN